MKKRIFALVMASLMLVALLGACSGNSGGSGSTAGGDSTSTDSAGGDSGGADTSNAEFEFNVNYTHPESAAKALIDYCDRIEEQSDGRIKFTHYFSSSLMSIPEIPKGLQDGIADISYVPITNYQQQFPLNSQILSTPFLGIPDVQSASDIYGQLFEEFPDLTEEFTGQGLTPIGHYPFAPYQLMMAKDVEITQPSDMNGMKLISTSVELQEMVANNGGAPITQPPTEYYASMEKGVADGVINHLPAGVAFGILPELTNNIIRFGDKGLFYCYTVTCIRTASLEQLPEDLQALFLGENAEQYIQEEIVEINKMVDNAMTLAEDAGKTITELSDDQIKVWQDDAEPLREATIAALEADVSPVARDIYNRAIELIEENG